MIFSAVYLGDIEKGERVMEKYRFTELVEKENGFEFYQAFRDEVDWAMGGKDDTYWFAVFKDGSARETYIGTLKDGEWTDRVIKGKGKNKKEAEQAAAKVAIEKLNIKVF